MKQLKETFHLGIRMLKHKSLIFSLFLFIAGFNFVYAQATLEREKKQLKVGAYYFDGWSGLTDEYHLTSRLKNEFANREPIWGWYDNTDLIMETQIDYAANNGLDYFSFCWYYPEGPNKQRPENNALKLFIKAKNTHRMQFSLMVANHKGFLIGPNDWDVVSNIWIALFKEKNYLTVDGHPILIFFSGEELLSAFGSPYKIRQAFRKLKSKAIEANIKIPLIGVCATPGPENGLDDLSAYKNAGFDFFTGYNYHEYGVGSEKEQDFNQLQISHQQIWNSFGEKAILPYIPVVTVGWDMRPWEKNETPQSYYYVNRTPEKVAAFVKSAIDWTEKYSKQTLSDRLVLLYAWNENGEGGYITPTKTEGDSMLRAIKDIIK